MTYPFIAARFNYGRRKGPALAFLVHMAEGGNTVNFLANDPPRGVSVHYVIENTGRIVQMLKEDDASGSANPNELRTSDDANGFYGVTAAKAVLGDWWRDPNSAVISLEIEGFASVGPSKAQMASLVDLVNDVRSRHPQIGLLGHRDLTTTKACPGRFIPWAAIGGHGPHGVDMPGLKVTFQPTTVRGTLAIPPLTDAIRVSDGSHYAVPKAVIRDATTASLTGGQTSSGYLVDLNGDELHFIRATPDVTFTEATRPASPQELADAQAAGRESFRADVEKLP